MNILFIDSTKDTLAVVINANGKYYCNDNPAGKHRHSEILLSEVDGLLIKAGLSISQIDLLGAVIGPGSFTGIRVGLATIKALAYATKRDTVAVNSLQLLAYNEEKKSEVLAVIRATQDYYYACEFNNLVKVGDNKYLSRNELIEFINGRNGITVCSDESIDGVECNIYGISTQNLINAMNLILRNQPLNEPLLPLYVAVSQAEKEKGVGVQK